MNYQNNNNNDKEIHIRYTLKYIFNNQKVEYPDPKDKKKRKNKNKGQNKGEEEDIDSGSDKIKKLIKKCPVINHSI
jgi:hypothetical protein